MKRLLGFLLLLTIFASANNYAGILPPEVKIEITPAVQSDESYEPVTVKNYGALFATTSLRRIPNFKHRFLSQFTLLKELAFVIPAKQFSRALSDYRPYLKPIGLKLIYPQHYFW